MSTNQLLGGLAIYHLIHARSRFRGLWWWLFVFLLLLGITMYYVASRVLVVWPYRLLRAVTEPESS